MKTRFPSILGVFAAILMVASFVVPMNIAAPAAVSADPGIMKWDKVSTPAAVLGKNDLVNWHNGTLDSAAPLAPLPGNQFPTIYPGPELDGHGNDIISMAVGNDGMTVVFISTGFLDHNTALVLAGNMLVAADAFAWFCADQEYRNAIYYSNNNGISATSTRALALIRTPLVPAGGTLFQVAIAPDDAKIWLVSMDNGNAVGMMSGPAPFGPLGGANGPRQLWYTMDAGQNWDLVVNITASMPTATIRCMDISPDYGGKRDFAFGTITAAGAGQWVVFSSKVFTTYLIQADPIGAGLQGYYAIKFSPTYSGDSSIVLVYATATATYYNVALRDLYQNTTLNFAYANPGIEVKSSTDVALASPGWFDLNNVCLQLPSDFSGQSASLRRAYISLDAYNATGRTLHTAAGAADGIFRIDDTTVYVLMDTSNTPDKAIYTIAYFGTYASGKLLAGERMGFPCTATVPTWFTDSPTTCPVPCWYPALKPTTGAANVACSLLKNGQGGAIVGWNADGSLGLVGTGSLPYTVFGGNTGFVTGRGVPFAMAGTYWASLGSPAPGPLGIAGVTAVASPGNWFQMQYWNAVANDESAFAISRNNGETWNQIALIDTTIDWFNDVAVAPDCTTIYLASVNRTMGGAVCNEFDSVWRATINPNVAAPLPAVPPLGTYWERVYARVTALNCTASQSDLPILRVVPSCTDKKDGEIVGWAAQGRTAMAWSPDYGDYWATITPRYVVQDFAFESSTSMYIVNGLGLVQRLPYTGTSWSTNLPGYATDLETTHTIVAIPDGKVLVGSAAGSSYPASYSADKGVTFSASGGQSIVGSGNKHVIFDVDFKNNSFVYMGDDNYVGFSSAPGTVYRNTAPSWQRWSDNDMMSSINGAAYIFNGVTFPAVSNWPPFTGAWPVVDTPPHVVGQFGLVQAWTGEPEPALYSAHDYINTSVSTTAVLPPADMNSAVCRTLKPRSGMPKPGIQWDCLDIFTPLAMRGVAFTLEPTSLKYCGCCTLDTNTTLYAIDDESGDWTYAGAFNARTYALTRSGRYYGSNNANIPPVGWIGYAPRVDHGMLWAYTDCLAKKGPILKGPADKFLIGADPVTGRNQQIDLSWEQLCLSTIYQLQVAKDAAFTLRINPGMGGAGEGNSAINITATVGSILLGMDATNMTSPAAWIAPGALPEAGAIYYWRIRSARSATQQIAASPWSEVRSFTVKAGFIVNTPYYGVQLLAPNNGCLGCKVKPAAYSWSPWKEATKYQIDIAKDPEFKTLVVTGTTTTTGYEYSGTLDYSTNYFWRVKALEVNGQNIPSDWSATFSEQTEPAPAPPAPPPAEPATPVWVWVIIAIGAILVIVTLVLIFKTRRV